ncbi:hypothetical protein BDC45DRAFT_541048 [Circinella umbellata]|nr:hypothetical protein BDC45DRAFT_541048 [Circinella umbellata]
MTGYSNTISKISTEDELLQFVIPTKHKPGTDKISKEILKDERIIELIVKTVVGSHGKNLYTTKESEWIDGKKADVVYGPVVKATTELPPILIEVQNTIDKAFARQVIKYCGHIYDQYDVEPIVIILSIHLIPSQILNTLSNTGSFSYMKIIPSDHWAQRVYFLDPNIIEESLPEEPLPPLVEEINIIYKLDI